MPKLQKLVGALFLLLTGGLIWAGVRDAGLVWRDHNPPLAPLVSGGAAAAGSTLSQIWRPDTHALYQPLAPTLWKVAASQPFAKSAPALSAVLHLLSLATHLGAALAAYFILELLLQNALAAVLGALLFLAHPLQVEAVAYISAYPVVLGTALALTAVLKYLQYCESGRWRDGRRTLRPYVFGTMTYGLALVASPIAVVAPLMAAMLSRLLPKQTSLMARRPPPWLLALWMGMALPQIMWSITAQVLTATAVRPAFWMRPLVAGDALAFYLGKILLPLGIVPDYGRSPAYLASHWWGLLTWVVPIVVALAITVGIRGVKSRQAYSAAFAVTISGLLPVMGLAYFTAQGLCPIVNHLGYFAMLGPALAAALLASMPKWRVPLVGVMAFLAVNVHLTRAGVALWQDETTLWTHAVQVNPTSAIARTVLGTIYRQRGDWQQARYQYSQALASQALSPDAYFYLGEVERLHGDPQQALSYFEKAAELDAGNAEARLYLGEGYLQRGDYAKAMIYLRRAGELVPESEPAKRLLGKLYVAQGQDAEAIPYLLSSLQFLQERGGQMPPQATAEVIADVQALLGIALAHTQQLDSAQSHLEAALRQRPDNREANLILAGIYFSHGQMDLARPCYEKAIIGQVAPFVALNNLGAILLADRKYAGALGYFQRALEQKPTSVPTMVSMGVAHFRLRQYKEATQVFKKALALQSDIPDPHAYLGDIARWQGREAEAVGEYYKALKIDANHVEANYRLANYFLKQGNTSEAHKHFQAALKAAPQDPRLLYGMRQVVQPKG